jgi:hypothetical protein
VVGWAFRGGSGANVIGMGIFDKAKDLLSEHRDTVDSGITKAGNLANERTGGQHAEHIENVSDQVRDRLDSFTGEPVTEPDPTEPLPPVDQAEQVDPAERVTPAEAPELLTPAEESEPTDPADPEPVR